MIDFTPAPSAAPRLTQAWAHARIESKLILRNSEQLLLALVIPISLLLGGRYFGGQLGIEFQTFAWSILALAIWSTCFTTLAITTAFERRYGVLERLNATSLGRTGLLAGKALAISLVTVLQLSVLTLTAVAVGWRPGLPSLATLVCVPLAMGAFAGLAMSLAGVLRAEATLGLANLIYLLGLPGGILLPLADLPGAVQPAAAWLPTMALGEAMRGTGGWFAVMVLIVWLLGAAALARRVFRWTS